MEKLNYLFNAVLPKKFIIWITALVLFLVGLINPSQFTTITVAYISANVIAKYTPKAKAIANNNNKKEEK